MTAVFNDYNNEKVASLPRHLRTYIVEQHYEHYTAVDHAVWRYVMRQNYHFLKDIAYYPYIPGLEKAGLTIERIPRLQEMNDALGRIGWGAVTVDGFIPPAAFMEYQEYHVLVIAADIRQLKHIEYTPAPDILHESAGHAPIIAEPDYNRYLSYFGSIGSRAMFSSGDFDLYEAIRELSILKEMPGAVEDQIVEAREKVAGCQENIGEPSEMALLSRLHWWTVEYGLIGTPEQPKIYGAGLLSSIGESASCMDPLVEKLWYSIDAVNYPYDITSPQPQLFVTPDFKTLIDVLDEFAAKMAFRTGGTEGIEKAISSRNVATAVLSSGLQVTGKFTGQLRDDEGNPCLIKLTGPCSLAVKDRELPGQGRDRHPSGFSFPLGRLSGLGKSLEDTIDSERQQIGLEIGKIVALRFDSGISVNGKVAGLINEGPKLLLVSLSTCTVTDKDGTILVDPGQGDFDLAAGQRIVSVFPGPADREAYEPVPAVPSSNTFHPLYTAEELKYHDLFQQIRDCRERNIGCSCLREIFLDLQRNFPDDWLAMLEILEILTIHDIDLTLRLLIETELLRRSGVSGSLERLIANGLKLITMR